MLIDGLVRCYESAKRKNWDKIYIAVDIHDTVVHGNYRTDKLPTEFYPLAKETLKMLSERRDVVLILYTCSWPKEIEKYFGFFEENGISFKYANMNPEVPNNALGDYTDKFYFNFMVEDKAGFTAANEWQIIYDFFKDQPILSR